MPTTEQERLDEIYRIARRAGLDDEGARVAVAIARTEGGLSGAVGDLDRSPIGSHGPFQFYGGGQLPNYAKARGLSVQAAGQKARTDWQDAAEWALSGYLGNAIKRGQAAGNHGAALATFAQRYGQVSQHPERAGQNYAALFGQGGQPGGGGKVPTPDVSTPGQKQPDYLGGLREEMAGYERQIADLEREWQQKSREESLARSRLTVAEKEAAAVRARLSKPYYSDDPAIKGEDTAAKAADQTRLAQLEQEIQDDTAQVYAAKERREQIEAKASRLDTDKRTTNSRVQAENLRLQQITQNVKDTFLEDQLKLINAGIAAGNLDARRADDTWKQVLDQAQEIIKLELAKSKEGMAGVKEGYDQFLRGAGRMGTQADADALAETMRGWGPILGREVEPARLGVQPFTPREDMAKYAPPAPDWGAAQQALTSVSQFQPSGAQQGPLDTNALLQQAQGEIEARRAGPVGMGGLPGTGVGEQPPQGPSLSPRAEGGQPNEGTYDSLPPSAQDYVRNLMENYMADAERRKRDSMQQALTAGQGRSRGMGGYSPEVGPDVAGRQITELPPVTIPPVAPERLRQARQIATSLAAQPATRVPDALEQRPDESDEDYDDRLLIMSNELLSSQP